MELQKIGKKYNMAQELQYVGKVTAGKLMFDNRDRYDREITLLNDCNVEIRITKKYDKRTTPHNKYYWGVIVKRIREGMMDASGEPHSEEEVHDFLKMRFSVKKTVTNIETGEQIEFIVSTAKMDSVQFMEYITCCKQFARDFLNIDIDNDI